MAEFHPPYNFVPVTGEATAETKAEDIKAGKTAIRHDMWQKETYSGRIVARLHLKTPTVVGGQHIKMEEEKEQPTQVKPYYRDDKVAIPANSLRGIIGNVAETLSQSALRVLEKKQYSVRKPMEQSLSAIGILRKSEQSESGLALLPLTAPIRLTPLWSKVFTDKMLIKHCVVAPIYGYQYDRVNNRIEREGGSFLDKNPTLESFHENKVKFYYVRPEKKSAQRLGDVKNGLLLGQEIDQKDILITTEYNRLTPVEQDNYVKGFFRILGIDGRESEIPPEKKREFFIPFPSRKTPNLCVPDYLPIPNATIEKFIKLAKERHDDDEKFPFLPAGYTNWQLESGQLVFFDIQKNNGQIEVSEISYSSIWRKLIEGDSHEFFRQINENVLPWNPKRNLLTPAECLFGVVESEKREGDKQARALASRVRFHDGQAVKEVKLESEVILKILSSPKPPSPAMYFHPKNQRQGTYIKKTDLNCEAHVPNGRKYYLHHPPKSQNWKTAHSTESLKQKMSCQPMQAGQDFYFSVDFDNLTLKELHLLIRSLHPSAEFQHRLGLGKPLGLGSIKIDIEGLFLINRLERYSFTGFNNPARYHRVLCGTSQTHDWSTLYPVEYQAMQQAKEHLIDTEFYTRTPNLIDERTLQLLQTIGNPANLKPEMPVKPPLTCEQRDTEEETFKWFGENDDPKNKEGGQALPAIEIGKTLPVLRCIQQRER